MHRLLRSCTLALLLLLIAGSTTSAQTIDVQLQTHAVSVRDSQAVLVRVQAQCPAGLEVLEALVTVSQEGASGIGGFALTCTGHRRTYTATVRSFGSPFEPGSALASAFVLLIDPTTNLTQSTGDSETIEIH